MHLHHPVFTGCVDVNYLQPTLFHKLDNRVWTKEMTCKNDDMQKEDTSLEL